MTALLPVVLLLAGAAPPERAFDFSVVAAQGTFVFGQPIVLRCRFRNVTSSTQTVLLPRRQSGAPEFLSARVWDGSGALVTRNDVSPAGWWSVHVLDSTEYREAKGDRVAVEPGRELLVEVDLESILGGCRALGGRGLRPGRYRVQLDSQAGASNQLPIEITSAPAPARQGRR